jgi:integrase
MIFRITGGLDSRKKNPIPIPKKSGTRYWRIIERTARTGHTRLSTFAYTGTRPSEATALRWGSLDLLSAKATFALSRHLREENAAKTRASRRTISLLPNVVELLKSILPLRVEPNSYVFTDGQGKPIDRSEYARGFQAVLRMLKVRPRPFYNVRTFISITLTLGRNQKWIAGQPEPALP